jgi:hypothetical protein
MAADDFSETTRFLLFLSSLRKDGQIPQEDHGVLKERALQADEVCAAYLLANIPAFHFQ